MGDEATELADVEKWLASTGFPLEYATVRALDRVGWQVDAGRFYVPQVGGAAREVDAVARTGFMYDRTPNRVRLVVECKHASSPWVILTRDRSVEVLDIIRWMIATSDARRILLDRASEAIRRNAGLRGTGIPDFLSQTPQTHGSAIAVMPRRGNNLERQSGHEALTQLIDAARGIVAEAEGVDSLAVSWPVLVIRGSLYQARLTDRGDLSAEPIEWQRVVWGGVTGQPAVFDVVRESYLATYGKSALDGLASLESALNAGTE